MSRRVSTVHELWTEWHHGLASQPSIEYLVETFGTKWRASSKEAKFFSRRRCVINHVRRLVNGGLSVEGAIDRADSERGNKSIDSYSKWLRSKQTS
ncbi:hypothetical protein PHYSODRAFT_530039 [Phytophthora sojae]|uniref:Transcription activator GCR1-like domain-containing protein n=1 Tax=Phytophthora sojae (strain P6497) TaxID=1094619 RepID=G5ABQ7_PHYSP|nr:hypothetical protein PHYSODRAFT_530039 [Phytophthora sojae]EGZ06782.1 hypothetical protein PHYSODRAFT_530039 [Phytophthora sojae]|eukprot:XP_009537546.1 hypothetical protein PHYSODRAFT_530039 [Phytophthora sojae]